MSEYLRAGSMGADLMVQSVMQEQARQARALQLASMAERRPAGRFSLANLKPARLLSVIGVAPRTPVSGLAR